MLISILNFVESASGRRHHSRVSLRDFLLYPRLLRTIGFPGEFVFLHLHELKDSVSGISIPHIAFPRTLNRFIVTRDFMSSMFQ